MKYYCSYSYHVVIEADDGESAREQMAELIANNISVDEIRVEEEDENDED